MEDRMNLDEQLKSANQMAISGLVKALPAEDLSLEWRSGLNEKLHAVVARRKKKVFLIRWLSPAAGLALAAGMAIVINRPPSEVHSSPVATQSPSVERRLLDEHNDAVDSVTGLQVEEDAGDIS